MPIHADVSGFSLLFCGVISSRIKGGLHQVELIAKGIGPLRDLNPSPYLNTWNCLAGPGENVKEISVDLVKEGLGHYFPSQTSISAFIRALFPLFVGMMGPIFFLVNLVPLCYDRAMRWPKQRTILPLFILLLLSVPLFSQAATFTGKVVGVSDGDTIKVMREGRAVQV